MLPLGRPEFLQTNYEGREKVHVPSLVYYSVNQLLNFYIRIKIKNISIPFLLL